MIALNRRSILAALATVAAAPSAAFASRGRDKKGTSSQAAQSAQYVEFIQVLKEKRRMDLIADGKIVKSYKIRLGKQPKGHKRFQGDGRTPEGTYFISGRNPRSAFHLSLRISYPNRSDLAYASRRGKSPGGDIFIHGQPNGFKRGTIAVDWTRGCIAVSNKEMEEIYRLIPNGCPIHIHA